MTNFIFLFIPTSLLCLLIGLLAGNWMSARRHAHTEKQLEAEIRELTEVKIRSEEKLKELNAREESLEATFTTKATEILSQTAETSKNAHSKILEQIVKPLKEELKNYRNADIAERASLKTEIEALGTRSTKLRESTDEFTRIIRGDQRSQGAWGERILRSVLESSGLKEGISFFEQGKGFNLKSEEGRVLKPDFLIKMPSQSEEDVDCIVVDSKVSLVAYENYSRAEDSETKTAYLTQHLNSVKSHIKDLSSKQYETAEGLLTVDYVFLFMAIESALIVAIEEDIELQEFALQHGVILVSQSMLIPAMRTVAYLWRRHGEFQNITDILKNIELMHKKFLTFQNTLAVAENKIGGAYTDIQNARRALSEGPGNLVKKTKDLIQKGEKKGLIGSGEEPQKDA